MLSEARLAAIEAGDPWFDMAERAALVAMARECIRMKKQDEVARRYGICDASIKKEERDRLLAEKEKLRAVVEASKRLINELPGYSTGNSVLAEAEVADLFYEWSEALDALPALADAGKGREG